jgi:hypothetical protein
LTVFLATLLALLFLHQVQAAEPVAAVFGQSELAQVIAKDVQMAGYSTVIIGTDVLTNSVKLRSMRLDLLVVSEAGSMPVTAMDPVRDYLQAGGRMMAFGLPAWESPTYEIDGKQISQTECEQLLDNRIVNNVLINFAEEDLSKWSREQDAPSTKTDLEVVPDGGQKALHVRIDHLGAWDILGSPRLQNPFAGGRMLTCLRARGAPETPELSLEWDEQDGSRWIAVIELTSQWKSYVLSPDSFHSWDPPPGRGGANDRFNVRQAIRLTIGLARSHNALAAAHHEYWVENIGTAPSPFGRMPLPGEVNPPRLDTLSPGWNFYPINGEIKLTTPEGMALVEPEEWQMPGASESPWRAMQPRPRGIGFNQERPWRWQPLLEARALDGDYRGAVATLMIHFDDEFKGGIWAGFTPSSLSFYQSGPARQFVAQTARAMQRGIFLQEGGGEFFTVFDKQKFYLGARVVNLGHLDQTNLTIRISVKSKKDQSICYDRKWSLDLPAAGAQMVQEQWRPTQWPEAGFTVRTELIQDGQTVDRLEHELNVWRRPSHPEFVEEGAGGFEWRGRPWKVNGVNYAPATVIGVVHDPYFEEWLGKGAYDPEVADRDLRRIKAMNLNTVSIFVDYNSIKAQHLLDFLRRCQEYGLHVNQALRPGTPMDFQWEKMKAIIEFYHLADNDTIFAYDLAWEPAHQNQQSSYGEDWTGWVTRRYGNVAQAEKVWGLPLPPFNNSALSVPSMQQLAHDGPWRILAADYRSFLDDELADKYGAARRLVRSIDPHHAVSFRMAETSDPTFISDRQLPYDFYGLSHAVDIWEPEGYGRIGDWNRVREGRFQVDYARLCDPRKPVLWAETGVSVWDEKRGGPTPKKLQIATQFYRDFYRMLSEAGSDGVIFWWYPGGYRVDERSDFGIINGDGTDRPMSRVIRQEGGRFLKTAKPPAPDCVIEVNRDRDARGIFGLYQSVKGAYWQAIADGKTPRLEWEKTPGQK